MPGDVTRALRTHKVENVADVAIDYNNFMPSGNAWITVTQSDFMPHTISRLRNSNLFGSRITAYPTSVDTESPRMRGERGRKEAAERSAIAGNGPRGGISEGDLGKCALLWGLPGKITIPEIRDMLSGYKLAGQKGQIVKLDPLKGSITARAMVRLNSVAEAYRLVRNLHMTSLDNLTSFGTEYWVKARVIV
ncbi:hypothetical protein EWM64_g2305 [Hericium alpestre]|uniref:RRM domain-containing protein n=1 Tax=Hericium alpestre TaxID=135208 RepID=A0A4Z0A4S2_9AGAM|nr:hypothetical protein EWM64_g2305 [Hericium alpestre]